MIEIRRARFADAVALAPRLRVEDALEISAVWSVGACEGLCYCLLHSDRSFALAERGEPLALWGVTDVAWGGLDLGIPWLLAAPRLFEHKRELAARSRRWVDRVLLDVDALTNLTDAGNRAHLNWLAWCGFRWLRDHAAYGRQRRPFREFYLVNSRRHPSDAGVRDLLLSRSPPEPHEADPVLARLVSLGISVLQRPGGSEAVGAALAALPQLLEDLASKPGRSRRAALGLLVELARPLVDHGPACLGRAWCETLLDVAEVLSLGASGADVADVVTALPPAALPHPTRRRSVQGAVPERGGAAERRPQAAPLARLAARYADGLTLGGRFEPVQGHRVQAAALGIDQAQARRPLGIAGSELASLFRNHYLVAGVPPWAALSPDASTPAVVKPAGDRMVERLRRALAGGVFEAALMATFDSWSRHARELDSVARVYQVAAAMADAVAARLLPPARLNGLVCGLADTHGLYRLLRARLLLAACEGDAGRCCRLLEADVGALLVAAEFEARLLTPAHIAGRETDALAAATAAVWGPVAALQTPVALALLLPVLAVPVVHACQLPPALLTWHLTACGRLGNLLQDVEEILSERQSDPRPRLRQVLRRWQRGIDIVDVRSHLGGDADRRGNANGFQRLDRGGGAAPG